MAAAHKRAMFARLPRLPAALISLVLCATLGWCLAAPRQEIARAAPGHYTDMRLYRDIVARMDHGDSYYAAATALQRQHHYPTRPFVTVRLPTLYWVASAIGWKPLGWIELALLIANGLIWPLALPGTLAWAERMGAGLAIFLGGLASASPALTPMSETWCGLLIGLAAAFALWRKAPWWTAPLCIAAALAIRELALPFAGLGAALAVLGRRRTEAAAWLAVIAAFALGLALHAWAVAPHVLPGDLRSPGWSSGLGPRGLLQALIGTTLLHMLPRGLAMALAFVPLLGWLTLEWREAKIVLLALAGYALAIALFPRPDNFYWGFLMLPTWFAGLALVPRGVWQLGRALSRR